MGGAMNQSYWICAFCVNQHAGICGDFGPAPLEDHAAYERWDMNRRDRTTGIIFECCQCNEPKLGNDNDACEMNKFDDMMDYLHDVVPDLRQLVAVDYRFSIFTRAWCVAELVQAHLSGLPQRVCLFSNRCLDIEVDDLSIYMKLVTLTVTDCAASRPEDKIAIIEKIPDVMEFDAQLQAIIFGARGLLSRTFKGFGVWEAAAHIARRIQAMQVNSAATNCTVRF